MVLLGASYCRELSIEERYLVENHVWAIPINSDIKEAEFFTKVVVGGNLVNCQHYTRRCRRRNSIVGLVNGTTVELVVFALIGDCCFAFAELLYLDRPAWLHAESECGRLCDHVKKVCAVETALQIVQLKDITDKYTFIDSVSASQSDTFIFKLPNILDSD